MVAGVYHVFLTARVDLSEKQLALSGNSSKLDACLTFQIDEKFQAKLFSC